MTSRLPLLLLLLGLAVPAVGQAPDPPRFLLESVLVEGVRQDAAREIVAAESLLVPGRTYSEQQLREAVYRVKRLPFVLDAELSLRKGSAEGSHQLVITVEPTRAFFYSAEIAGAYDGDARNDPGEDRIEWGASASVGGRWFAGSQGLVSAGVQGFDDIGAQTAQLGYTRYNLFGRGGYASLTLATNLDQDEGDAYQGTLSVGVPIVGNHALRADVSWSRAKDGDGSFSFENESSSVALGWVYDTTDDPLFPASGRRLTGTARYSESEQTFRGLDFADREESESYGLDAGGRRHWSLTPRQSVSTGLTATWDRTEISSFEGEIENAAASLGLGHSMDLWGLDRTERIGDFRWETGLALLSSRFDSPFSRETTTDLRLTTGLAFRNAWGLVRLDVSYVDNLQEDLRAK